MELSSNFGAQCIPTFMQFTVSCSGRKTDSFLSLLLCTLSAFGSTCARSEPLSSLWFETWDRKSSGFIWHFSLVTAESLFPPGKKKKSPLSFQLLMCTFFHSWRCSNVWPWKDLGSLLGQGPRGHAFLLTSWCFWWSSVLQPLPKNCSESSFSSFLWWVRMFERPYLNFIKITNCPFNLMHLFGVYAAILLCLAHDPTPLAAAGDVRSSSPQPQGN